MTAVRALPGDRSRPESPENPAIELRDLRMRYGTNDVLRGIDLTVRRGEVIALLGPNGAGKTTTIEILEGFRSRSAGEVKVLGVDPVQGGEAWRAKLGVVLQTWRDHGRWKVWELLDHLGQYYRPYATPDRDRPMNTDELIHTVALHEFAHRQVKTLSGGQRRRLDVAIGIIGRPELLFLDEPTAGFDPHARRDFHDLVHRLADLEDMTILLTTHDLAEAEKLAERILILAGGRIIANGSPAALSRQVAGKSEVRWRQGDERFVHATEDATDYVRNLFAQHGEQIADLEVQRSSLEDAYLAIVQQHERGQRPDQEVLSL